MSIPQEHLLSHWASAINEDKTRVTSANQGEAAQNEIYNQTSNEGRINIKQMPILYETAFIYWVR